MDISLPDVAFSYRALLNVGLEGIPGQPGTPGLANDLLPVTDGLGILSPMSISKTAVNFSRTGGNKFQLDGDDLLVSASVLNNLATATLNIQPTANQIDLIVVNPTTKRIALANDILNINSITLNTDGYIKFQNNGHFTGWKAYDLGLLEDGIYQLPGAKPSNPSQCLMFLGNALDGSVRTIWQTPISDELTLIVTQTAHGFVDYDILKPNGTGGYALAQANNPANGMSVVGFVSQVIDPDNFVLTFGGTNDTFSGLTPGGTYWLSDTMAGKYTPTPPVTGANKVQKVLFMAISATRIIWLNHRGNIIPSPPPSP